MSRVNGLRAATASRLRRVNWAGIARVVVAGGAAAVSPVAVAAAAALAAGGAVALVWKWKTGHDPNYADTPPTYGPVGGTWASNGVGKLVTGSIERSNVDIASEFSKLILAQRAYTANTRIVTASDEMLQDTINMKR